MRISGRYVNRGVPARMARQLKRKPIGVIAYRAIRLIATNAVGLTCVVNSYVATV
jgi:hypothetical protein